MDYVAVIFDVIDSKLYLNRYEVQKLLVESTSYLNYIYQRYIKKDVVPSAGDEFQGLFYDLQSAYSYLRKLQLLIYPVKIRSGIGKGGIKYYEKNWQSSAIDGETYYLARDAIKAIPSKAGNIICFNTGFSNDKYLNMYCLNCAEIKNRQSSTARLIELLADILSPIGPNRTSPEHSDFYYYVLQLRQNFANISNERFYLKRSKSEDYTLNNIDIDYLFSEKKNEEYIHHDDALYFNDFWERGMSIAIADAMNTTRQNVERYIALGKIKESRTMDGTIINLLGEKIW